VTATATVPTRPVLPGSASLPHIIRAEWRKFRTVRSTYWSLLALTVLGIGLSALISAAASNHYANASPSDKAQWDPTSISQAGFALAQLALGVLGVLIMSSEFSTGSIQTTLAAVPRRTPVLAAKAIVFGLVALVVGEVLAFIAFFVGQSIIKGNAPYVTIGDHDVLRAVVGSGLYAAVLGILALSIATIVRNTAFGIVILVLLLYVLPGVSAALPANIEHTVEKFWPTQAGGQITDVYRNAHTLSPWAGLAWFAIFTAIIYVIGAITLRTRDV
jgi:ABC-2 type transport system permease protein